MWSRKGVLKIFVYVISIAGHCIVPEPPENGRYFSTRVMPGQVVEHGTEIRVCPENLLYGDSSIAKLTSTLTRLTTLKTETTALWTKEEDCDNKNSKLVCAKSQ